MTQTRTTCREAGRPVVNALQAPQSYRTSSESQGQRALAREMEQRSLSLARDGLEMRGADRFNALALASTYAVAARDAALIGAGA